jgi:hypothetical protein
MLNPRQPGEPVPAAAYHTAAFSGKPRRRGARGGAGYPQRQGAAGAVAGPSAIVAVISEQEANMAMTSISWQAQRIRFAAGLPEVLESAWHAFECMLAEAEAHEDPATPLFPAFVLAATAAANGRDAVLLAPSLPWPPRDTPPGGQAGGPGESALAAAQALALLSQALISRLETAAGSAASSGDRGACRFAAGRARAIYDLLAGAGDD